MKAAWLSNFHSKHCPGLLEFPFGSIATREIEQNRQRMVLSQLPVGIQPEGWNMLLNMNYSLLHLAIFFQIVSAFIGLGPNNLCNWCGHKQGFSFISVNTKNVLFNVPCVDFLSTNK